MTAPEIEIEQEIERTREHLGNTAEELTARADVRARAGARATEMRARPTKAAARLRQRRGAEDRPAPGGRHARRRWPVAAVAAGAIVVGSALVRRRRRKA